ncbi:hypothetical protein FHU29_004080 [Hoyosella altamirensis]|uniref:Uncharacterized protein n=1 Tax=Hoyosella altamirensis TaxID=616997 RepID=A0A839RRK0_9ACTN|nr:hypothetical protein [Hoyosella altamirensis]
MSKTKTSASDRGLFALGHAMPKHLDDKRLKQLCPHAFVRAGKVGTSKSKEAPWRTIRAQPVRTVQ